MQINRKHLFIFFVVVAFINLFQRTAFSIDPEEAPLPQATPQHEVTNSQIHQASPVQDATATVKRWLQVREGSASRTFIATEVPWGPQEQNIPSDAFLVVMGIPTTDTPIGSQRRTWQRNSWMKYRGVWSVNRQHSSLIVNYIVGVHPSHGGERFSNDLIKEADQQQDILAIRMLEGKPKTGKVSGGGGYWGLESEVGMSRKALIWYRVALEQFPTADYIMKADDDIFIRVPLYLRDLRRLPSHGLYYGKVMKWFAKKGDERSKFYFAGGMAILMTRDVAETVAKDEATEKLIGPFQESFPYKDHNFDHEDVMVGRILYRLQVNFTLVRDCRMHDVHTGENKKPLTFKSLVIHHLKEEEYYSLLTKFGEDKLPESILREGRTSSGNRRIDLC